MIGYEITNAAVPPDVREVSDLPCQYFFDLGSAQTFRAFGHSPIPCWLDSGRPKAFRTSGGTAATSE